MRGVPGDSLGELRGGTGGEALGSNGPRKADHKPTCRALLATLGLSLGRFGQPATHHRCLIFAFHFVSNRTYMCSTLLHTHRGISGSSIRELFTSCTISLDFVAEICYSVDNERSVLSSPPL